MTDDWISERVTTLAESQLREIHVRRQAQMLRLEAMELAVAYEDLISRLDPEIVADDVGAVICAWAKVGDDLLRAG
jgi:hypothetical protein